MIIMTGVLIFTFTRAFVECSTIFKYTVTNTTQMETNSKLDYAPLYRKLAVITLVV